MEERKCARDEMNAWEVQPCLGVAKCPLRIRQGNERVVWRGALIGS
jgi:hypothetical protein